MTARKAALILEDGTRFDGRSLGHAGEAFGVAVCYTGVVGYQEVLTDPSYRGTLAVLTYPIAGAYGVNGEDGESPGVHPAGLVVREYSRVYSNWRATGSLEAFLKKHRVVGIADVDTRAVAVHLRERGEMLGAIVAGRIDAARTARKLKALAARAPADLVADVTWHGQRKPRGETKHRLAVLNLGVTEGLLDQLADLGCAVQVRRASAPARKILDAGPQGVLVVGGPGDPRALGGVIETARALVGQVPVLGIGLGHQVLALALGCRVERMKAGHRGVNYPVIDRGGGPAAITVQNHGYVVEPSSVPDGALVTHLNLNDKTVEGIRSEGRAAWGVQFHPSRDADEAPSPVLRRFLESL